MSSFLLKNYIASHVIDIPEGARADNDGNYYVICPFCSDSRKPNHRTEKKLAIVITQGNPKFRQWRCNHCGESGYGRDPKEKAKKELYPKLKLKNQLNPVPEFIVEYFVKRGIGTDTITYFGIRTTEADFMTDDGFVKKKCIAFPSFDDDVLVDVHYRSKDKHFMSEKGGTKIIFNINDIKLADQCILTEGRIDAMSVYESGVTIPVGSVPNGVTISDEERSIYEKTGQMIIKSSVNLKYIDLHWEFFSKKQLIYIGTDIDAPGVKLRMELARRFGKHRCKWINWAKYKRPDGQDCKDANDVLKNHGPMAIHDCVETAQLFPVEGVITVTDVRGDLMHEYDHGIVTGLSTGFKRLDSHFRWVPGWLIIGNGYPGMGKTTTWLNFVISTMFLYNWKWGGYLSENYPEQNVFRLAAEIIGGNTVDSKFSDNRLGKQQYNDILDFLSDHLFLVNKKGGFTPEELREKKEELVGHHGINGFLCDPWKSLNHRRKGALGLDEYIQEQLNAEVRLAQDTKIINFISHHPNTPMKQKEKTYDAPSPFEIIGGQVWFSTCYAMLCCHRNYSDDSTNSIMEIHVQKIKEHKIGGFPTSREHPVNFEYMRRSNRLCEIVDGKPVFPIDKSFIDKQLKIETW